jgi:hypothetical protein
VTSDNKADEMLEGEAPADDAALDGEPTAARVSEGPVGPNKKSSGQATAETLGDQGQSGSESLAGAAKNAEKALLDPGQTAAVTYLYQRSANVAATLQDKEGMQMAYVRYRWPRPYYVRWKGEANDLFVLAVTLKRRRERIRPKAG